MKKLTVAFLAAAAVSSTAMANSGFYLGASAGVAQTNVKYNYQGTNAATPAVKQNTNFEGGKAGGLFGLFAGYGMTIGQGAYLGGEIYGGFDTTTVKPFDDQSGSTVVFWTTKLERKNYYGLAARLGYMITPSTLAYIRLAVESGKWKATLTPGASSAAGFAASPSAKIINKSKTGIQFAPGAGFEVYLNKNLFVRAEYSYLFGPKLSFDQDTSGYVNTTFNGNNNANSLKTSQHAMKVGIGYKF